MVIREGYPPGVPCSVDLSSDDIHAASRFYTKVFGWEAVPAGPKDVTRGYTWLELHGRRVAAIGPHAAVTGGPRWNVYIEVDNCERVLAAAERLGGAVTQETRDVLTHGRFAMAADPQGAGFSLWESQDYKGAEICNEPIAWCFNHLATTDVDAALSFYCELFEWDYEPVDLGSDMPRYRTFTFVGRRILGCTELLQGSAEDPLPSNIESGGVQPQWVTHFAVDDCDQRAALIEANGGTIVTPPRDNPAGRGAGCRDPQGAYFGIIKLQDRLVELTPAFAAK